MVYFVITYFDLLKIMLFTLFVFIASLVVEVLHKSEPVPCAIKNLLHKYIHLCSTYYRGLFDSHNHFYSSA